MKRRVSKSPEHLIYIALIETKWAIMDSTDAATQDLPSHPYGYTYRDLVAAGKAIIRLRKQRCKDGSH